MEIGHGPNHPAIWKPTRRASDPRKLIHLPEVFFATYLPVFEIRTIIYNQWIYPQTLTLPCLLPLPFPAATHGCCCAPRATPKSHRRRALEVPPPASAAPWPPRAASGRRRASSRRAPPPPATVRLRLGPRAATCATLSPHAPLSPLAPRRRTGSAPLLRRRRRWLVTFNISNSTFQYSMIPISTFVYIVFNILLSNVEPI